ncbi:5231_t:CDS:1, partial [Funneliformis mosseae]
IDEPSQIIIVTANRQRERALGTIKNVLLIIQGILIKMTFQVIDSTDQTLLLGID